MNCFIKILVKTNKVLFISMLFVVGSINGQEFYNLDTTNIDTLSISAKAGFDASDFIRMTKQDTSFYRAFQNLKLYPHSSQNKVNIFNKKWEKIASLSRAAKHNSNGKKGWISDVEEKTDGKIYNRKGEHKFFTAEMYDKVFFQKGKFPVGNSIGNQAYQQKEALNRSKEEKYYEQLKTFMFSPGTGVEGVPLIGKKLNIFEGEMVKYYDYSLEKTMFRDSISCYKFTVKAKENLRNDKVVITDLTTFYDRRTMKIIARSYSLEQSTVMFSFNIQMFILLGLQFNEYLPLEIKYNGEWDIPFKKPERISFQMNCSDYTPFNKPN